MQADSGHLQAGLDPVRRFRQHRGDRVFADVVGAVACRLDRVETPVEPFGGLLIQCEHQGTIPTSRWKNHPVCHRWASRRIEGRRRSARPARESRHARARLPAAATVQTGSGGPQGSTGSSRPTAANCRCRPGRGGS